jgi:hypothetical protein
MIMRALQNGDATFGQGRENFLSGQQAIAQNIQTNLYCFLRDCYFDIQKGVDWIRFFSVPTQAQEVTLSVRGIVLQCFGVVKINSLSVSLLNRKISITMNINTEFTTNYQYNLEYVPVS